MKRNFKINVQLNIALILVMKVPRSPNNDWKWEIGWMDGRRRRHRHHHNHHRRHFNRCYVAQTKGICIDFIWINWDLISFHTQICHVYITKQWAHLNISHICCLGSAVLFAAPLASYIVRRHIGLIFHYLKWHSIVRATIFFFSLSLYIIHSMILKTFN